VTLENKSAPEVTAHPALNPILVNQLTAYLNNSLLFQPHPCAAAFSWLTHVGSFITICMYTSRSVCAHQQEGDEMRIARLVAATFAALGILAGGVAITTASVASANSAHLAAGGGGGGGSTDW
jgi:hypothetical protein